MKAYLRDPKTVKKEITDEGYSDEYAMTHFYEEHKNKPVIFKQRPLYINWFKDEIEHYNWHISWLKPATEEGTQLLLDFE